MFLYSEAGTSSVFLYSEAGTSSVFLHRSDVKAGLVALVVDSIKTGRQMEVSVCLLHN